MVAGVAGLRSNWHFAADPVVGKALYVDCSRVRLLSAEMLSRLISLQGRLKQRRFKLVLSGLRAEVRDVLRWTKIDRFFEIEEGEFHYSEER